MQAQETNRRQPRKQTAADFWKVESRWVEERYRLSVESARSWRVSEFREDRCQRREAGFVAEEWKPTTPTRSPVAGGVTLGQETRGLLSAETER